MVAFFAGAAVAALATCAGSNSESYNYAENNTVGFWKAPDSELGEYNYGDHYEQRLHFKAPSIKHLFNVRGKYFLDCSQNTHQNAFTLNNLPCYKVLILPDQKFTRPIYVLKQKLVRFTGDKILGKWTYTHGGTEYNTCLEWNSGLVRSRTNVNHDGKMGSHQGTLPLDADVSLFSDIRNSPAGDPLYPSLFGRYRDPSTMMSALNERVSLDDHDEALKGGETKVALNDIPYLELRLTGCVYGDDKDGIAATTKPSVGSEHTGGTNPSATVFAAAFNHQTTGEAHRAAFLDAVPEELGFEYTSITESKTIDQMMRVGPPDSPSVFDIVSLSIGSVALAIGLGFLVTKILPDSVLTGSSMGYFAL